MQVVGKDIDSRVTIYVIGAMHKGLDGKLTADQHSILGLPSRTPAESIGRHRRHTRRDGSRLPLRLPIGTGLRILTSLKI